MKGNIYLYTGDGGGKTTTALGLAMRAIGHNQKVIMIQFMKGRKNIGEYKIQKRLKPNFEVYQFGRKSFVNLKKPDYEDTSLAHEGFEFAQQVLKNKKPNILILDEINLAVACKLLDEEIVVNFLKKVPESVTVVLTGRYATKKLIDASDFVVVMQDKKHPYKSGQKAKKGIQY